MAGPEALQARDEVFPAGERPVRALVQDPLGQLRTYPLDHLELGLVGQVQIDEAARQGPRRQGDDETGYPRGQPGEGAMAG